MRSPARGARAGDCISDFWLVGKRAGSSTTGERAASRNTRHKGVPKGDKCERTRAKLIQAAEFNWRLYYGRVFN
jgi:hypothetical protein